MEPRVERFHQNLKQNLSIKISTKIHKKSASKYWQNLSIKISTKVQLQTFFFSCHRNIQHCSSKGNQLELVHHPYQPEAHYSSLKPRSKKKQEATCERFHFGCQQYISHQKYLLKNGILHFRFLNIGFWDIKEARLVSSCAKCHDATSRSRQRKRPCLYFIVWILLIKKMTQHKICNFLFDTFLNLRLSLMTWYLEYSLGKGLFINEGGYPRCSLRTK